MKKFISIVFWVLSANLGQSQDTTDVSRLKKMEYLKYTDWVNCDSSETNLDIRICLNLEFQKVDSIMNSKLVLVLKSVADVEKIDVY